MRPFRILRGVLTTALVWATSWAIMGALANTAIVAVSRGGTAWLAAPDRLARIALSSASAFGIAGALIGCVFALALAVSGRRTSFETLTGRRILVVGALGGLVVAGSLFVLRVALIGYPARGFLPDFALAGALSAATAWVMLRIARRAPEAPTIAELAAGDAVDAHTSRAAPDRHGASARGTA